MPSGRGSDSVSSQPSSPDREEATGDWRTEEEKAADIAQAVVLREQAGKGGLRFEAYLPPGLAEWVLDLVAHGVFADPSEAVFVIVGEHKDLAPHADLRRELLNRTLRAAMDDPRPPIPGDVFFANLKSRMDAPLPEPAEWKRRPLPTVTRRVLRVEDLSDAELEAIANAEMDPRHDHLNAELE